MKFISKFLDAIFEQTYALLGFFIAWIVLEGSARAIATIAIPAGVLIYSVYKGIKDSK